MYNKNKIKQIRILPTSEDDDDFKTQYLMKNYFLNKLSKDGKFHVYTFQIKNPEDTLVLFQYNNSIVACGIMEDKLEMIMNGYNGCYFFDETSIRLLKTPITKEELIKEDVGFERFGKTSPSIDMDYFDKINELIKKHYEIPSKN